MNVVIIGNGVAGIEAALALRAREPNWSITIVSEESDHFFSRTALMWVHCGQMSHRDIEPYERDLYDNACFIRVRARATGVDFNARTVRLAGGLDAIRFDQLILACGAAPRAAPWPGSDLRGVGHFVTMQDLEWYEREIHGGPAAGRPPNPDAHLAFSTAESPYQPRAAAAAKRGQTSRRPAVIGGGLIGIEAIEVAVAAGLKPMFLIREEWFWPVALDRHESSWIKRQLSHHGVDVRLEENVDRLEGDAEGNVSRILTDRGEHAVDCVVVAIGVVPNTAWLRGSEIELDRSGGIVVDRQQRTNVDGVYAAGDCASVTWFNGAVRPEQLWYTGRDQGRVAAATVAGEYHEYDRGIWYNSAKLMDIEYTTAGVVNMNIRGERNWFFEETGTVRSTTRITVAPNDQGSERVVGFNLLGRRWDHEVLIRWIREHRSLEYVLKHLPQASFDTEFTPPLRVPRSAREHALDGPATSVMKEPVDYGFR